MDEPKDLIQPNSAGDTIKDVDHNTGVTGLTRERFSEVAFQLLQSGKYEVIDKSHISGYTGKGSGIKMTRDLVIDRDKGIVVGFGKPWGGGSTEPEQPVWFYGFMVLGKICPKMPTL